MNSCRILALAAIFSLGLAQLAGCEQEVPAVAPVQGELAGFQLLLTAEGRGPATEGVRGAVEAALIRAGFSVVLNPRGAHHLAATLRVSAVDEPSILQVRVNGRVRRNYRVSASLSIVGDGRIVEQTSATFSSTEGAVSEADVSPLVASLGDSPKLARFAAEYRARAGTTRRPAAGEGTPAEAAPPTSAANRADCVRACVAKCKDDSSCEQACVLRECPQ